MVAQAHQPERRLAEAFLAVRVQERHDGGWRALRDGLLAAAFLAVRVQERHDGGRRALRDGLLAPRRTAALALAVVRHLLARKTIACGARDREPTT
jgi:hypothetical protein